MPSRNQPYSPLLPHGLLLTVLWLILLSSSPTFARSFKGEGSDLLMGVGAQNIARGGAVTAATSDLYSSYWNPAGLAEISGYQVALSRQLDGSLDPLSFIGVSFTHPKLTFYGIKTVLAYSWIPRLHIDATGKYDEHDFESTFTHYALPDLPVAFDGHVESKTRDHRFTMALTPAVNPTWSLGLSIGRVDCRSNFCGAFAEDPGNYTVASVGATAITVGIGAKYYASEKLTLGLNIKDLNTTLNVKTVISDDNGTRVKTRKTSFPREITTGFEYHYSKDLDLTTDLQYISGSYGGSAVDFKILRAGVEKRYHHIAYRCGLILPLTLKTSQQDFAKDLPAPVLPTLGLGWSLDFVDINFALYPNPLMSAANDRVEISTDLSLVFKF